MQKGILYLVCNFVAIVIIFVKVVLPVVVSQLVFVIFMIFQHIGPLHLGPLDCFYHYYFIES